MKPDLLSLLPYLAAGAGALLVLLLALLPYRRGLVNWIASLVRDPTTGDGSSKRTAGMSMIYAGIASILWHPDAWAAGAVLIGGGFTCLGIASNDGGSNAFANALAALRGVLPMKPSPGP